MPKKILKDAVIDVNGTTFTTKAHSVTLNASAEVLDVTGFTDDNRSKIVGFKDWTLEVEFFQDFDSGQVDATLWPLYGSTSFTVGVKATTAAVSETNPRYNGPAILPNYTPITGTVGEVAMTTVTFEGAGTLARSTA